MLLPKRVDDLKLIHKNLLNLMLNKNDESIILDDKVDEFISWYLENMMYGYYTKFEKNKKSIEMRNFIEKMAVWYELRYPEYEVNRLMPGSKQENIKIDDVMFNSNKYITDSLDEDSDVRVLDWDEFYNAKAFISSLPWEERCLFQEPKYNTLVYVDIDCGGAHLHLTSDGIVEESEGLSVYTKLKVRDNNLQGMHIKDVVELLKSKGVILPKDNELEATITDVENWKYQREEMLNCVMYRIIERGGNRIGPRRAFLFAKEFGRNIDIPMMYGVDYTDPGLRIFVNEYIKAGGSKDLVCYVDYFQRLSQKEKFDTVSVQELIKSVPYDYISKYTPEETELQQRMVNALVSQIDFDVIRKEEVQQLRLQRKLEKSRNKK